MDTGHRVASTTGRATTDRVLIVSGSFGAGHDAAAHEISDRLRGEGWRVDCLDISELYPLRLGQIMKWAYFRQLGLVPGSWGLIMRGLDDEAGGAARVGRTAGFIVGCAPATRIATAVDATTAFVIATHPFAAQALGRLRQSGQLAVPAVTYLTDPSVHSLWVHRFVDVHLAVHDQAAQQARAHGACDVRVINPLTPVAPPPTGDEPERFRAVLGLPRDCPVALVAGGAEGVGDVLRSALDIRDTGAATPVVLCGRNTKLRRRLERIPGAVAVGWLDGLTSAIRAADCVVQNAGGFTALESLALGTPVISYRCLPGHGVESARALCAEGLVPWPDSPDGLDTSIRAALTRGCGEPPSVWSGRPTFLDVMPPLSGAASVVPDRVLT